MGNPLRAYLLKHKHAYSFRTPDHWPDTELRVEYHRGYVRISHPRQGEFYITRNAYIKLIRHSLPVLKHMDEQFSVPRATARYLRQEAAFSKDLRAQKKQTRAARLRAHRRRHPQ